MIDPQILTVPRLGDANEITVAEISVSLGERVKYDQSVITLETDTALFEIPSPVTGRVEEIRVNLGEAVAEGDKLICISIDSEKDKNAYTSARSDNAKTNKHSNGNSINKYQRTVLIATVLLTAIALLFPPFQHVFPNGPLAGFYPLFSVPEDMYLTVDIGLLAIEILLILSIGATLYIVLMNLQKNHAAEYAVRSAKNVEGNNTALRKQFSRLKSVMSLSLAFIAKWWWVPLVLAALLRLIKVN